MIFIEQAKKNNFLLGEMPIELQAHICPSCKAIYLYFHFFFYEKHIYLVNHNKDCSVKNLIKILEQVASINKKLELIIKKGGIQK